MPCTEMCAHTPGTPSLCLVQLCVQSPYHTKPIPCTVMCANTYVTPSLCLIQQFVQIPLSHEVYALHTNVCKYPCHTKPMPCTVMCGNTCITSSLYLVQQCLQIPLSHQVYALYRVTDQNVSESKRPKSKRPKSKRPKSKHPKSRSPSNFLCLLSNSRCWFNKLVTFMDDLDAWPWPYCTFSFWAITPYLVSKTSLVFYWS